MGSISSKCLFEGHIQIATARLPCSSPVVMKNNTQNKTGNRNTAQATLAEINAKIAELNQRRIGLAEPLKNRYAELLGELNETGRQIKELDETWKPASLKPKADDKIREIITAHGSLNSFRQHITTIQADEQLWYQRRSNRLTVFDGGRTVWNRSGFSSGRLLSPVGSRILNPLKTKGN